MSAKKERSLFLREIAGILSKYILAISKKTMAATTMSKIMFSTWSFFCLLLWCWIFSHCFWWQDLPSLVPGYKNQLCTTRQPPHRRRLKKKTRGKEGIGLIFTIFTPSTQHEYENTCNIRHFNPSFLQLRGSWEKAYKASDRTHQWQATEKMRQQMLVTLREHVL